MNNPDDFHKDQARESFYDYFEPGGIGYPRDKMEEINEDSKANSDEEE